MKYQIKATVYNKRGKILSVAYNNYDKTHPEQARLAAKVGEPERVYLHAEVAAIIKAMKVGHPFKIKIERYNKAGKPALAEPCPICKLAIYEANIKFVEYSIGK